MLEGFDFSTPAIASQLTGKLAAPEALQRHDACRRNTSTQPWTSCATSSSTLRLDAVLHPASWLHGKPPPNRRRGGRGRPAVAQEELTAQQWFERGVNATDPDEKIRFYSEAIRLQPDFADAFNNRGSARDHRRLGRRARRLRRGHPPQARLRRRLQQPGRRAQGQRRLDGALADYDEAIRLQPDYATPSATGAARRAKATWTAPCRLRAGHPPPARRCRNFQGSAQLQRRTRRRLADCTRPSASSPTTPMLSTTGALRAQAKGDLDGALADYRRGHPPPARRSPAAFNNRGHRCAKAKGDSGAARSRTTTRPSASSPTSLEAFNSRGRVRHAQGDFDGALADYDEAIRLNPDFAAASEQPRTCAPSHRRPLKILNRRCHTHTVTHVLSPPLPPS